MSDVAFLEKLEAVIRQRIAAAPESSYTARLAAQGILKVAQKVGEEGVEVALAAAAQDKAQPAERYQTGVKTRDGLGKYYFGREIAHYMSHVAAPWLDRPERDQEERPDLVMTALGLKGGETVADLGCGTGELTAWLHQELQASETVGIDSSPVMLAETAQHTLPGMRYEQIDIMDAATKYHEAFDLVFSNAALQWILGHDTLFPRIAAMVKPGGQLAVQIPANGWHVGHQLPAQIAHEEPFASALGGWAREDPVSEPEFYMDVLHDQLHFRPQRVRMEIYTHEMTSTRGIVEWVKGSVLSAYRERLPADLYPRFVEEYERRLVAAIGDRSPYLYPFKRILFWGRKPR